MVGAALACALHGKGLAVALVEARPPARDWPPGEIDLRGSAISRASQRLLTRLGAWERIRELGASPYRQMRVWDAVGGGRIHFDSEDLGETDLGHIVENRVVQLALWEQLECAEEVTLVCPGGITDIERQDGGWRLLLTDGRTLGARLLVGADGRDSLVRALAGIAIEGSEYGQRAIVATLVSERWHQETAWQRFLPTGPLALLPLRDGRCSLVWSASDALARDLMALDDGAFADALTDASEACLGRLRPDGPRAAVALRAHHAKTYVEPGLALIGDAAHAIHPLAGQGVNLGLRDVAALRDSVREAKRLGRDFDAPHRLQRWARARRSDNVVSTLAFEAINRTYSNDALLPTMLRGHALGIANALTPLRNALWRHAAGR